MSEDKKPLLPSYEQATSSNSEVKTQPQIQSAPIYVAGAHESGTVLVPAHVPMEMFCPYDQKIVVSELKEGVGCKTWTASAFLCLFCWPCFWVPFCCKSCMVTLSFY
jgi:hypothetical protein